MMVVMMMLWWWWWWLILRILSIISKYIYIYISNQFHVLFSRVGPWSVGNQLRDLTYLNEFGCSHLYMILIFPIANLFRTSFLTKKSDIIYQDQSTSKAFYTP